MKYKKIYLTLLLFFLGYATYQNFPILKDTLFLPQEAYLQAEYGRIFIKKEKDNLYCSERGLCGYINQPTNTGFDFINKNNFMTNFLTNPHQKSVYTSRNTFKNEPIPLNDKVFSFQFKMPENTIDVSVHQDGTCYNQNESMPFSFLAASQMESKQNNQLKTDSFSDMRWLILKNNDGSLFVLEKQKDDIYQQVTHPPQLSNQHRFLLLLSSYKRPIYLVNQVKSLTKQTYPLSKFDFSVSLKGVSKEVLKHLILPNFEPLIAEKKLYLSVDENKDQLTNLLNTYRNIDLSNYDYLCKIDDDDFYHKDYLSTVNILINTMGKPTFLTAGNLVSIKKSNNLFLKSSQIPFVGATICFSKEFAINLLDKEKEITLADKIYEDFLIHQIAKIREEKYLYLTLPPHFIYNQTTSSIMRPN